MSRLVWLLSAIILGSCELEEVMTAESQDIVIAEVYLRTDAQFQQALLHRTKQPGDSLTRVPGARVEVTNTAGAVMRYHAAADTMCLRPRREGAISTPISCYISDTRQRFDVLPGERYTLRITLPDGRIITGSTSVPSDFMVVRPAAPVCSVQPRTRFEVTWTSAANAWVYPAELVLSGLRDVLAPQGIQIDLEPVRLLGLAISATDTTIVFPSEFGIFDRFDEDLTPALVAIQEGLPPGVTGAVYLAAADRNYVNWERGGNFNPSGVIRIGNLRGDGAGVFGSLVGKSFQVRVGSNDPPC